MKHCDCNVVHYVEICCAQTNIVENIIIRALSSPFKLKSAILKFWRNAIPRFKYVRANVRQNITVL